MNIYIQDSTGKPVKFIAKHGSDETMDAAIVIADDDSVYSVVDDLCMQSFGHTSYQIEFL